MEDVQQASSALYDMGLACVGFRFSSGAQGFVDGTRCSSSGVRLRS